MRDYEMRQALRRRLENEHAGEDALILDELGICEGEARVDLAVVNGSLNGFEIKSEVDTLRRLQRQVELYGQCFDAMTLIVSENHLDGARKLIPAWWGIWIARRAGDEIELIHRRITRRNSRVHAASLVQLLWRDEAAAALRKHSPRSGIGNLRKQELQAELVEAITLRVLKDEVREALKARGDWRQRRLPVQGNGSQPIAATTSRSQARENLAWLLAHGSRGRQD